MNHSRYVASLLLVAMALAGCGAAGATASSGEAGRTASPSAGVSGPAAATPTDSAAPAATNASSGALILAVDNGPQAELTLPSGRHIYFSVISDGELKTTPTDKDVLLINARNTQQTFTDAFPGQTMNYKTGQLKLDDVTITGIGAAYTDGDPTDGADATDTIYVIETGGLRIVHFGELGQLSLTPAQLQAIGRVDVAISQLYNHHSTANEETQAVLKCMAQVTPRVFVPFSPSVETLQQVAAKWKATYTTNPTITFSAATLPAEPLLFLVGPQAATYGKALSLQTTDW